MTGAGQLNGCCQQTPTIAVQHEQVQQYSASTNNSITAEASTLGAEVMAGMGAVHWRLSADSNNSSTADTNIRNTADTNYSRCRGDKRGGAAHWLLSANTAALRTSSV